MFPILSSPPAAVGVSSVQPQRYPLDLVAVPEVGVGRHQVHAISIVCAATGRISRPFAGA